MNKEKLQAIYDQVNILRSSAQTNKMFLDELYEQVSTALKDMGGTVMEHHEVNIYGWGDKRNPNVGCCKEHMDLVASEIDNE